MCILSLREVHAITQGTQLRGSPSGTCWEGMALGLELRYLPPDPGIFLTIWPHIL